MNFTQKPTPTLKVSAIHRVESGVGMAGTGTLVEQEECITV
jgi:hypothetical protein